MRSGVGRAVDDDAVEVQVVIEAGVEAANEGLRAEARWRYCPPGQGVAHCVAVASPTVLARAVAFFFAAGLAFRYSAGRARMTTVVQPDARISPDAAHSHRPGKA
jgi:hypothetical protein